MPDNHIRRGGPDNAQYRMVPSVLDSDGIDGMRGACGLCALHGANRYSCLRGATLPCPPEGLMWERVPQTRRL